MINDGKPLIHLHHKKIDNFCRSISLRTRNLEGSNMRNLVLIVMSLLLILLLAACKEKSTDPNLNLPIIETNPVAQIYSGKPNVGVTVVSAGASPITDLAICWGEAPHPDLNGDHRNFSPSDSSDPYTTGMSLYDLNPGAKYYVRCYAKNSHGEVWSEDVSFTMLPMLWDVLDPGTTNSINSVFFHDENVGWICGSGGMIKKSTDGGSTWTTSYSGTSAYLLNMKWFDQNNAWIVGNQNTVLRTTNGGDTWQSIDAGTIESAQFISVYFENPLTGYLVSIYGAVFKTSDGGSSWQQIRNEGSSVFNDVWACGDKVIMVGEGLRISEDGGATWRAGLVLAHEYQQILYREPNTLWVVGINEDYHSYGVLYKSDDLGETWTVINTKAEKGINSICLAPGTQNMWLVGKHGVIFSSTNDGLNWTLNYNLMNTIAFQSVCAVNANTAWIAGYGGKLLKLKHSKPL